MTYGISTDLKNSNGEVIVDQNFACMEVLQEGSVTWPGGNFVTLGEITYSGILFPIVFVKLLTNVRFFFGPTTTTKFWFSCNAATGTQIDYKVCGIRTINTEIPAGYGALIMKKGSNQIAFCSKRKYARIIDILQVSNEVAMDPIRAGDDVDFTTAGDGSINKIMMWHHTKPIPINTFWHARMTGLVPRPGSNNSNVWTIERKSTVEYHMPVDGPLPINHRQAMNLQENTGNPWHLPYLIAE